METVVLVPNLNYEKCGEVLTAFNVERRLFAFKCFFCENSYGNLNDFICHIEESHFVVTKKEKDLLESEEHVSSISIEPKEELLDEDSNGNSLDPLTNSELNTTDKQSYQDDDSPENRNIDKIETDDECSNVDYEGGNNSGAFTSSGSETEDAEPRNSFLDSELDTNQNVTLALIKGLEKLPVLWKKSNSQPRIRKKREEALRGLAKELNKQFGKRMKWTGIDERIKKLCKRYRRELIKERNAESKGEIFTPTWYFPKLDFLRSTLKPKRAKTHSSIIKKSTDTEEPFDDEQHRQFIKIYESFPCLWNIEDVSFKSKPKRENALKQIVAVVEEKINIRLTEDEIQRRIRRIRTACIKEKHEILNSERVGTTHQPTFKYFSSISFLLDHVCPFKCPYCSKAFKGREVFRVHKAEHDGSSPFTCSICKKSYSSPGNLAIHLRRHNRDYAYECKPCSRKFATTDEYNIHMRKHTGEKPFFCEVCGKSFSTCSLFGRHKRRHEKRPSHFCTICNRGFYEQIRFKEHMNIHNNVRDRVCDVCGKGFTHLKYLNQHKLIHTGRRDYVCTICAKGFAQSAGLYWHMKTHGAKVSEKVQTEEKGTKKETTKERKSTK